jgi:hypothetical protein
VARKIRTLLLIAFVSGILLPSSAAFADPPSIPPLTPPAPSFLTCQATGAGPICRGQQQFVYSPPTPSGLVCGTTAQPIELLLDGTDNFQITRYYNTTGYITGRFVHEDFAGTIYNPATGRAARTTQIANFNDTFAVPGIWSSLIEQMTGVVKFYLPGSGVLLREVGRSVVWPDGSFVESGPHQLDLYFDHGDHSVLEPLCDALGSPGTP